MTAWGRRGRLLEILNSKRYETVGNLAKELNVSKRTILRDIEKLSLDVPIGTMLGRYGGVYLLGDYKYFDYKYYLKPLWKDCLEKIVSAGNETGRYELNDAEIKILNELLMKYSKN